MDTLPPLNELDGWLAARESRVPGLKPGVAAGVVWAQPDQPAQTDVSLIYLHGYTASRGEIAPVPDEVARVLGANVFYARLTGHGRGAEGHRSVSAADWIRDGREAWAIGKLIGRRVVVMATSTGGTLAAWMVLGPDPIVPAATVLVSPNLTPKNRTSELLLLPGRRWLLRRLVGESTGFPPQNEKNAQFWDCTHHTDSLIAMMDLVARTRGRNFHRWPSPVLVVYDPADPVVDERVTVRKFSSVPGARLREWKTAAGDHPHVLAGDALSPGGTDPMVRTVVDFLRPVLGL